MSRIIVKLRERIPFLYWFHEYAHALVCKILRVKYLMIYSEKKPIAIIGFSLQPLSWKTYIIGAFPILLLLPFYIFDWYSCIKEEIEYQPFRESTIP